MSWWGCHPKISREEAVALIGVAPCRLCLYWFRVFLTPRYPRHPGEFIGRDEFNLTYQKPHEKCPDCGLGGFRPQ